MPKLPLTPKCPSPEPKFNAFILEQNPIGVRLQTPGRGAELEALDARVRRALDAKQQVIDRLRGERDSEAARANEAHRLFQEIERGLQPSGSSTKEPPPLPPAAVFSNSTK